MPGDRFLVAEGGRGGRGNARFLSNRRRAPAFAEQGERGEERWCDLELRLAADVALIGFPNVGKSTPCPHCGGEINVVSFIEPPRRRDREDFAALRAVEAASAAWGLSRFSFHENGTVPFGPHFTDGDDASDELTYVTKTPSGRRFDDHR